MDCEVRRKLVNVAHRAEIIEVQEKIDTDDNCESHRSLQSIYSMYSTLMGKNEAILS
jgi:hypothetical protein